MSTTEDRIKKIVADQLGVELQQVTLESRPEDDLGADSLDLIELVMAVEEEFEIDIRDEQAECCTTVNDAVELVDRLVAEQYH